MIDAFARWIDDAAGLEKTLRLFHGICIVGASLFAASTFRWAVARDQLALTRRFFRFMKWQPCFATVSRRMQGKAGGQSTVPNTITIVRQTFLGLHFFLEAFCLPNAMGIAEFTWAPTVQREALKCWFYALAASIASSLWALMGPATSSPTPTKASEKARKGQTANETEPTVKGTSVTSPPKALLLWQLATDSCDILIPGFFVGWLPVSPAVVGSAMVFTTLVVGSQIWRRVQSTAS